MVLEQVIWQLWSYFQSYFFSNFGASSAISEQVHWHFLRFEQVLWASFSATW